MLMYLWCTMDWWKNLVFFSPSLSHCTLDFCHQSISSCFFLSSNSSLSSSSSFIKSVVLIHDMKVFCRVSNRFSISFILWRMFPKTILFHHFRCSLKFLSHCWKLYMQVPCSISSFFHQEFECWWKLGWDSHDFSNRKGMSLGIAPTSRQSETGQWSEPIFGRILASMERSSISKASEMRKC